MNFRFWKKQPSGSRPKDRHARPRELSDAVGIYMVTKLNEDPDWVWTLKAVERPQTENRHISDIRIFDPREARIRHIQVENFTSLDAYPELVVYAGSVDTYTDTVQLERLQLSA